MMALLAGACLGDEPAAHRLHVLLRVVSLPGFAVDSLPILPRHLRMRRAGVVRTHLVQVGIDYDAEFTNVW